MFFWFFNIFLLILVFLCLVLVSGVWPPDSPWSPWWKTTKHVARLICKLGKVGKNDIVYDLGCGTGDALVVAGKEFGARGVGIEIDPVRYLIAKSRVKQAGLEDQITIVNENFFNVDFSDATMLFIYLVPKALKKLTPKFKKELKPGTKLISYRYELPVHLFDGKMELLDEDKRNKFYLYEIKKTSKK